MLDGVVPAGVDFVQNGGATVILGADHRPIEGDGGQRIDDVRHHGNVRLSGGAFLPRLRVDDLHATAIGGEIRSAILQLQVVFWCARTQLEITRHALQGFEDHLRGKFYDFCRLVNPGAMTIQHFHGFLGGKTYTHVFKDVKRGLLELLQLFVGQVLCSIGRAQWFKGWKLIAQDFAPFD